MTFVDAHTTFENIFQYFRAEPCKRWRGNDKNYALIHYFLSTVFASSLTGIVRVCCSCLPRNASSSLLFSLNLLQLIFSIPLGLSIILFALILSCFLFFFLLCLELCLFLLQCLKLLDFLCFIINSQFILRVHAH